MKGFLVFALPQYTGNSAPPSEGGATELQSVNDRSASGSAANDVDAYKIAKKKMIARIR